MFETILVGILLYYFYRLYSQRKNTKKKPRRFHPNTHPQASKAQDLVIEEMKRCPTCATFNPKSYAVYYEGEYFCSIECRNHRN